jgi:carbonic anhydrase
MTQGVARFRGQIFPQQRALYHQLARDGQKPKALMISCADSRVIPEMITQSRPGELFVCRNAGNIVPPFEHMNGGVSSAIEYAVVALGVHDIVVCGHSECGAMSALLHPEKLSAMPNVAAWLRHSRAAEQIVTRTCPVDASDSQRHQALAMENVLVQVNHLRTHPAVAAALATRSVALHGWFFDLQHGAVLAYDGRAECFIPLAENSTPPVAVPPRGADAAPRLAAE